MELKRGDIVVAAASGDYGKPRPYVVVQADALKSVDSVILCPITSDVQDSPFRLSLAVLANAGLKAPSEVMVEKVVALRRDRVARVIGRLPVDAMTQLDGRLAFVLGLRG